MKKQFILACVVFSLTPSVFALPKKAKSTQEEYDQALQAVNQELSRATQRESCPGTDLVVSCGNHVCDKDLGENENNCATDCLPALVRSYNAQTLCSQVQARYTPSTREELKSIVESAISAGKKVKVVGASHSASGVMCSDGIVIGTENLNKILRIESYQGVPTVVVEPGVIIYDLAEWLHERGYSLGYTLMGFRGVTIAGAISTGSHGSSPRHTAVVSNRVESVELVNGNGESVEISSQGPNAHLLKAARASLGLLGAITQVRLRIEPQFNLEALATYEDEEKILKDGGLYDQVKDCDYGQLNWFPGTGKFVRTCGVRTEKAAVKGAQNVLLNPMVGDFLVKPVKKVLQYGACHKGLMCALEKFRYWTFKLQPPFEQQKENGDTERATYTVGPSHRMMSSFLTIHQDGFRQMDWEIVVPLSKAQKAVQAVHEYTKKNKICLPLVGVFVRFAPAEEATLMAHTTAIGDFKPGEPAVFLEMPVYVPTALTPEMESEYQRQFEDYAKLLIGHYSGRAHWGKNRDWTLKMQRELGIWGNNFAEFQKAIDQLDPKGVFSNELSTQLGFKYQR